MTINKDSNPQGRIHQPKRAGGNPQAHERLQPQGYKDGEERNPREDRVQGSERTQKQGRGNDPDKG